MTTDLPIPIKSGPFRGPFEQTHPYIAHYATEYGVQQPRFSSLRCAARTAWHYHGTVTDEATGQMYDTSDCHRIVEGYFG